MTKHHRRPQRRSRRPPRRRRHLGITLAAGFTIAACSGGNEVADLTTVPAPPATAATPTTERTVSTTAMETTSASTAPDATDATDAPTSTDTDDGVDGSNGVTGPMFSDALGTKVESAPGVNTRGDTRQLLPEGLYVHIAWEPDPDDPSVFTVQPDDIPILEAYANAASAFYRASLSVRTTDAPEFEEFFVDGGAKFDRAFADARSGNFVKTLGKGAVLRPYVLADNRTASTAVIFDCALSHERWISGPDESGLLDPQTIGTVATIVFESGKWIVDTVAEERQACL